MKKYIKFKKIILIIIIISLCSIFPNNSKAAKTGFIENLAGPRKYFTVDQNKLEDVTLTIVGSSKIDEKDIKLYMVDSKGSNPKEIQFSSSITTNKKNHIYTLSHDKLLKGKTNHFYIEIKDSEGNINNSRFTVYVKENSQKQQYYSIDDSPRIIDWLASNKTLHFAIRDTEGIKTLKIQDANNNNKEMKSLSNIEKGRQQITTDISKFKTNNGVYKIKIIANENDASYSQSSTQTVTFRLSNETVIVNPTSIKLNKKSITIETIENKTAKLKVLFEPAIVTNKTIKWTTSNKNIATVDNDGKITAVKPGTVTITATTTNGKKATCTVKVSNAKEIVEKATKWMENIAANNIYGYNNNGYYYGQNNSFNCIGLNAAGWANAGTSINYKSYSGMKAMIDDYLKNGFINVTETVNLKTQEGLQRGDVLARLSTQGYGSTHVEQYCGNGQMVGAREDRDGKIGDSTGSEIAKSGYANYDFEYVLRYVGKD